MTDLSKKQKSFITTVQKKISKTIYNQQLIQDGDKVVVGLSGGKDSFILLDALAERRKHLKFNYEIKAVHINVTNVPYEIDLDFMQQFCDSHKIDFQKIDIEIDLQRDTKLSTCFICSWHRRTALFKFTTRNGFNKLAFGHHLDDAVETLLLNMSFNGEISSMPYKVSMLNDKFQIIRPMLDTEERFFIEYANLKNLNREVYECPFAKISKRELIRKQIKQLEDVNKDIKKNIFKSMNKIIPKYLP